VRPALAPRPPRPTAGRAIISKLKSLLDQQQFEVAIQAAANGHVVARETIRAYRKNVLAKCYGDQPQQGPWGCASSGGAGVYPIRHQC
jgi:translation elongation factor EF-4